MPNGTFAGFIFPSNCKIPSANSNCPSLFSGLPPLETRPGCKHRTQWERVRLENKLEHSRDIAPDPVRVGSTWKQTRTFKRHCHPFISQNKSTNWWGFIAVSTWKNKSAKWCDWREFCHSNFLLWWGQFMTKVLSRKKNKNFKKSRFVYLCS